MSPMDNDGQVHADSGATFPRSSHALVDYSDW